MVDEKALHLLEVLKDVNRDELISKLNKIKQNNDNHISHLFLEDYFKIKDEYISPEVYQYEAQCIVNIFPQYSVEYIQSMLETLGSENNRVIVILRQLLKNEPMKPRIISNENNSIKSQTKMEPFMFPHASTSNGALYEYKLTTVTASKNDSPLKRKSAISTEPTVPKIKIKIIKPNFNTDIKNSNPPETCTSFPDFGLDDFPTTIPDLDDLYGQKYLQDAPIITFPDEDPPTKANSNLIGLASSLDTANTERQINQALNLSFTATTQSTSNNDGRNDQLMNFPPTTVNSFPIIQWAPNNKEAETTRNQLPDPFAIPTTTTVIAENQQAKMSRQVPYHANFSRRTEDMLEISSGDDSEYGSFSQDEQDSESSIADFAAEANVSYDSKLVSKIMEMFPDASPTYVKELCVGKIASPSDIEYILQLILSNPNYPKRKQKECSPDPHLDLEEQVALLREILPDADPNYLQYHAELYMNDKEKLKEFMSNALESKNYPTMKEYMRKQQLSAQVKQYTSDFNVEKFLELIPDPDAYFNDPTKKSSLMEGNKLDVFSLHYARGFLKNHYPMISIKTIHTVMDKNRDRLIPTVKELDNLVYSKTGLMKSKRKAVPMDNSTLQNIPLLQEIAYLNHRDAIKQHLEEKETKGKQEKELAKQNGLLRTCNCCYSDEVMPKNIVTCENGCDFCSECVKTSAEILFGEGKLDFPCLQDCGTTFSLQTLKNVLAPKMFSKMAQRKQLEEVKAAGIEELEMCPFCDFATIPAPGDKLFRCLNPECMKESCRQCKEPSHVPLRCDEIEKDDDVKRRTYIENKMTEALIRICYKCGMKFIKADGCNKMTCSCGAMMCYVCNQPVTDYKHFNGQGGDNYHLCPLYSDTNELHKTAVILGAEAAKAEIGVTDDPTKLKIDPTADLHQHYKSRKHKDKHPYAVPIYGPVVPPIPMPFPILNRTHNVLIRAARGRRHLHHRHHHWHRPEYD